METESHYAFIIWKRATWTFFKTSPLVYLRRKVIAFRWLNNVKMFISGYTVPLVWFVYIRCNERFPLVVFSSRLSLVRPLCEEHSLPECELFSLCIALEPCRMFLKLCRWPFWLTKPRLKLWPAPLRVWLELYLCQSQEVNNSLLKKENGKRIAEKCKGLVHSKNQFD